MRPYRQHPCQLRGCLKLPALADGFYCGRQFIKAPDIPNEYRAIANHGSPDFCEPLRTLLRGRMTLPLYPADRVDREKGILNHGHETHENRWHRASSYAGTQIFIESLDQLIGGPLVGFKLTLVIKRRDLAF